MSTTVTYKGDTITTVDNGTRTLLTQDRWVEDNIIITDETHGGVETETDPVFSASPAASISQSDILNWNGKSNFSGNYDDLTNKPTLPAEQVNSDWNASSGKAKILNKPALSEVALTGNYSDLLNKPTIPTSISDLNDDSSFITSESDPVFSASPAAGITANDISSWNNKSDFSGSYNDLTDKPTIVGQVNSDWDASSGVARILNKPTLATIAITGNYNDLTNKPIIDTALSTASLNTVQNQAISIALEDKASIQYVDNAISNIPSPMVFKGSLGSSGTISALPNASTANTGFTYKVIEAGTYASQTAEIGDIFISDGTAWILVPSGDDVANVVVTPVQSSGTKIAVITVDNTSTDLYTPAVPAPSTTSPSVDGTAAAGTSTSYARADHIHPTDTSRASATDVSNLTTRVGSLETAIGTGGSVEGKITTAIEALDSSIAVTANEAISGITITDGKISASTKISIPSYSVATTAANGLMSAADKAKINALSTVDNNTTYDNATTATAGLMTAADKVKLNSLTTYGVATTAANGLMSSSDKLKLDNCSTGSSGAAYQNIADGTNNSVLLGAINNNIASGQYSIAEGYGTQALGNYSHTEGYGTVADDAYAHAEGYCTNASTSYTHAEGNQTTVTGISAHAEGQETFASNIAAHAEGNATTASGEGAHSEGAGTLASTAYSHAEGAGTTASGPWSHAEGNNTIASSYSSHAEGCNSTASGIYSHAQGYGTLVSAQQAHAEGINTTASGNYSHAEGYQTLTKSGNGGHAQGHASTAQGNYSHSEGQYTKAQGDYSHVEGLQTLAKFQSQHVFGEYNIVDPSTNNAGNHRGNYIEIVGNGNEVNSIVTKSNARTLDWSGNEVLAGKLTVGAAPVNDMDVATKKYVDDNSGGGASYQNIADGTCQSVLLGDISGNIASGQYSIAEGLMTTAEGEASHAEGKGSYAQWDYAHAEGLNTTAASHGHAEGIQTFANASPSHAEGIATTTTGQGSHTEGYHTEADGDYSHSEGYYTLANFKSQHVFGECNIADPSTVQWNQRGNYIEIVGNGTTATRSNARTLDWSGNEVLTGTLTVGADPTNNMEVATKQYVDNHSGGSSYQSIADGSSHSVLLGNINQNTASGQYSIAEGHNTTASGWSAHAQGGYSKATGARSHAEGDSTLAAGTGSHSEGNATTASGDYSSHAEGSHTQATGNASHAEGYGSNATTLATHAEGNETTASRMYSHAEGNKTHADGMGSHTQGYGTKTGGNADYAHAEGNQSTASQAYAHAEGGLTLASGWYAHTEGFETQATDRATHAEGLNSLASGQGAHAEGNATTASGYYSHTNGDNTVSKYYSQTVIGKYNTTTGTLQAETAFVIGNGTSVARSDAFAVKWDGTLVFANGTEITPAQFAQLLALLS